MPAERILICGAGVAGSILAYWLAQNDFQVTVIERSRAGQKIGQGIEIEEPALQVVKAMGILDQLNERRTEEKGFNLVDAQGHSFGRLEAGGISPTGSLELMRGDLTDILYKTADQNANVTYKFETIIHSLRQTPDKVYVDLENRNDHTTTTSEFDLVIGADGVMSRTRQLTMGSPTQLKCMHPVGAFVAWFSIPAEPQDNPYSQLCHFPGRRILWMRPVSHNSATTSVYLIHTKPDVPSLRDANASGDRQKQKAAFADLYAGCGGETPRVLAQMLTTENFYSDELVQVKLASWSRDRVVLVGDAAWAPSPFTGQGNQLAIIGAWVLAQELSRNRSAVAFGMYERRLRAYVESAQSIPLRGYAPLIFNPETEWGIWLLRRMYRLVWGIVCFVTWTNVARLLPDVSRDPDFDLEMDEVERKREK